MHATETQRWSGLEPNSSNVPKTEGGSITFLNMSGDITILWDEQNRERILEIVRKKMAEGYTFFTTKRYLFGAVVRKSAITQRDLSRWRIQDLIISDEEFELLTRNLDDRDVADLVRSGAAALAKPTAKATKTALARAKSAEEVLESDALAVRPLRGG